MSDIISARDHEVMMSRESEQRQLEADAARWRYVRDNLAQMHSPKMDGQHSYRFNSLHGFRGNSVEEAIDKAIEHSQSH